MAYSFDIPVEIPCRDPDISTYDAHLWFEEKVFKICGFSGRFYHDKFRKIIVCSYAGKCKKIINDSKYKNFLMDEQIENILIGQD